DSKEDREELTFRIFFLIPKQGGRRMVHRANSALGIDQHHTIGGGIQNRFEFVYLRFKGLVFKLKIIFKIRTWCSFIDLCDWHQAEHDSVLVAPRDYIQMGVNNRLRAVGTMKQEAFAFFTVFRLAVKQRF